MKGRKAKRALIALGSGECTSINNAAEAYRVNASDILRMMDSREGVMALCEGVQIGIDREAQKRGIMPRKLRQIAGT